LQLDLVVMNNMMYMQPTIRSSVWLEKEYGTHYIHNIIKVR